MKVVSVYQTDDGKTFETKEEARNHEVDMETLAKLRIALASSIQTGRVESVIKHLLVEAVAVGNILASYRKQQPRKKQEGDEEIYGKG